MSGQPCQTTPARTMKSSPNGKQGPMKATIPISSVLKQNSNLRSSTVTNISPTSYWKCRISPEHTGQRSPGSLAYKGKTKIFVGICSDNSNTIRRTASLDTIYLKGQWPKDICHWQSGLLQVDKTTQTDESDLLESREIYQADENESRNLEKSVLKSKLLGTKEPKHGHLDYTLTTSSQTIKSYVLSPTFKANPVNIPVKPSSKSSIRSSVEGLNQEIERLVLKSGCGRSQSVDSNEDCDKYYQLATPEGHRAPLGELLRISSRSVNTQTPNSNSSGNSQGSSPDQESTKILGTSPHINNFLAREPPDGCERVSLKSLDEAKCLAVDHIPQPCTFKLKPSLGSAFKILQPVPSTPSEPETSGNNI